MKKVYTILAVLTLILGFSLPVLAETEKCDFSHGPLIGQAWDECELYVYQTATAASSTDTQVVALRLQIIDLLQQLSILMQ